MGCIPKPYLPKIYCLVGGLCLVRHIQKWWNVMQKLIFRVVGEIQRGKICTGDQKLSGVSWNDSGLLETVNLS